ncbi:MAG: HPr family phosphocarrier protein [Desulfobacterales bacterium]|jgi:phosphotransferase system HPr (HPr) family protein
MTNGVEARLPMKYAAPDLHRPVTIVNELGLHARSAAKIAEVARNAKHKVWIVKDTEKVEAANILDLLALGCPKGTEIVVRIENPNDRSILNQIIDLVEAGFGE